MTSAYAGTPDYERFMADLLRAKVKGKSPELRVLRGVKPKPSATSISPVLSYMEQVVTDLVGQHGCRHSIAHVSKLREFIDSVLQELVQVNNSDERIELTHINSLRQNFICLNTTMVMQDGKVRWEFKDSHATVHDLTKQQSGIAESSSLPDIKDGNGVFDKLYSDASTEKSESTAGSDASLQVERKENAYVIKSLRSRLKKSEVATALAEKHVEELEDGRTVQGEAMAKLKEEHRLLKVAHATLKRKLLESQAENEQAKLRERAAEAEGRSEAQQELQAKRREVIKQDQRIERLLKETNVAKTELKVRQGRLDKAVAAVSQAKLAKEQLWVENRRLKGATSDAQALVRVLQEKGTTSAHVAEYGLRELAEKDRMRGQNIELSDHLEAEKKKTAELKSQLIGEEQKVEMLQQSLEAAEQRCRELNGQLFNLKCDLENVTEKVSEREPKRKEGQQQQPSFTFRSSPKPNVTPQNSSSMAMALASPMSSSSSAEAYGSEEDFEDDDEDEEEEKEDAGGGEPQHASERTKPTVVVTLGLMNDDEARDSVSGQGSNKSLPSPISPIKRARENAFARHGATGRLPK